MIVHNVEQGGQAWFKLRRGIPTASEMHNIITPKTGVLSSSAKSFACKLLIERLLNWQAESLDSLEHIARGKAMEPLAVRQYEFTFDVETKPVGFITTDDLSVGASPDRLIVGANAGLEVKAPSPLVQMKYLMLGHDEAYKPQVQCQMLVAELDRVDFFAYHERMPHYIKQTGRDEEYIGKMRSVLSQFQEMLAAMMEKAQSLGVYQAFAEMVTPLDAERGDGIRRDPLTSEAELAALLEPMKPGEMHRMGA